jgi:TonB family protein
MGGTVFKRTIQILIIVISSGLLIPATADDSVQTVSQIEPAERIEGSLKLEFPSAFRGRGREAWVDLDFVINEKGEPQDVTVVDISGSRQFGISAKKSLEKSRYKPARLNGVAVESSQSLRIYYLKYKASKGASRLFVSHFKQLIKWLGKGDLAKSKEYMAKLEELDIFNLYEDAYLNIARYNYAFATNQPYQDQLLHLSRALSGRESHRYLPNELYIGSLEAMFKLQAYLKDYSGALDTYKKLTQYDERGDVSKQYEATVVQIEDIKQQPGSYGVSAKILDTGYWRMGLHKNRFSIHELSGTLEEIRLFCSAKHVVLSVGVDQEYVVPESYGKCSVVIKGARDTRFEFRQSTLS